MRSIDLMVSRPGVYVVNTAHQFAMVEVDAHGRCFQLELGSGTFQRDGELRPGRWNITEVRDILGPFARTAHTALKEPG